MCQEVLPNCVSTARCNTPTLLQTLDKGAPPPLGASQMLSAGTSRSRVPFHPVPIRGIRFSRLLRVIGVELKGVVVDMCVPYSRVSSG